MVSTSQAAEDKKREKTRLRNRRLRERRRILKGTRKMNKNQNSQLSVPDVKLLRKGGVTELEASKMVRKAELRRRAELRRYREMSRSIADLPDQWSDEEHADDEEHAEENAPPTQCEDTAASEEARKRVRLDQKELDYLHAACMKMVQEDDGEDLSILSSFLADIQTVVSVRAMEKIYRFFYNFTEAMTRMKLRKKCKKSYRYMRRKMIQTVPPVLVDILLRDGTTVSDKAIVSRSPDIIRQVNKVSLKAVIEHVYRQHGLKGVPKVLNLLTNSLNFS